MEKKLPGSITCLVLVLWLSSVVVGCSGSSNSDVDKQTDSANQQTASGPATTDTSGRPGKGEVNEEQPDKVAVDPSLTQKLIARRVFDPALTGFAIQVFYEAGAEPYTGAIGLTSNDTWDIARTSYGELFAAHTGRVVSTPRQLAQMNAIPDQGIQNWSVAQLVELGDSLAPPLVENGVAQVIVIFLNGLYDGSESVLGVHPRNSPFSFVFKEVVKSVGGDGTTQRYVEQATVVHEIGHTIGFVDNGVPMVNAHEDTEHPHHTLDQDGVMYWAVESGNGILGFLTDVIVGGRLNLFGSASLLDAQNYMPDS